MSKASLALIGGGAAATLFLAQLMRMDGLPPISITIFDRAGSNGTGIAYGTRQRGHLLNVRAEDMSAFHGEPDHFVRWLAAHHEDYGPHDFAPRMVYGAYLRDIFSGALKDAQHHGYEVTQEKAEIVRIDRAADGALILHDRTGTSHIANHAVVMTGNAVPLSPPGAAALSTKDGYHDDPWNTAYEALADADHIIILGTGLSMVDCVVSLDAARFRGRVTAVSRHGLTPAVHGDSNEVFPLPLHTSPPATAREALRLVRTHARGAEAQGLSWQAAVGGLRHVTNDWWLDLPPDEQRKLRRILPFWSVHRHRTAPVPGGLVRGWRDGGRLTIAKGRVTNVAAAKGGIAVTCGGRVLTAPHAINCLGYACAPASAFPGSAGGSLPGIGPALCDRLLETTAIPEIRREAAQLAEEMAQTLCTSI